MQLAIRPTYRRSAFIGFCLWTTEPVGKVYPQYKLAALALESLR